ncbi:MAG TPA: sigma-70 family RNA polymerase sigma factor, partial [Candidatus Cloacimonadota bacterium]|nr:sigma-70 family RNA polymerase sigma factor [Candidatus Cloacimonadota bacterium]
TNENQLIDDQIENYEIEKYKQAMKKKLMQSIQELPERERIVISLYYYEQLSLKEIGIIIGVTESRVSQIHSSAIIKLRNSINMEF